MKGENVLLVHTSKSFGSFSILISDLDSLVERSSNLPSKVVDTSGKVVDTSRVGEIAIFAPYLTYDVTPSRLPRG